VSADFIPAPGADSIDDDFPSDDTPDVDPIEADFVPQDPGERALELMARGYRRAEVAADLGVDLETLGGIILGGVVARAQETGSRREAVALLTVTLDDIVRRAYVSLDDEYTSERAELLGVLLGTVRLRAQLIAGEVRP
jgi:hypothetical protein